MWTLEEKKGNKVSAEITLNAMIHEVSRNDWEQIHPASWQEVESLADGLSALAAEISAYAGMRGANGTGDHGHEEAMKAAQKARKRVRKALGYSYP